MARSTSQVARSSRWEINHDALELVERDGMSEVFGCARMVLGPITNLRDTEIFGVTTFELG